jgi:hypothetical protein
MPISSSWASLLPFSGYGLWPRKSSLYVEIIPAARLKPQFRGVE